MYKVLIQNLENAINELEDAIFIEMSKTRDAYEYSRLKQSREECLDITYHKCKIIDQLKTTKYLDFKNEEPF